MLILDLANGARLMWRAQERDSTQRHREHRGNETRSITEEHGGSWERQRDVGMKCKAVPIPSGLVAVFIYGSSLLLATDGHG